MQTRTVSLQGHMMYGNPQIQAESEHYPEHKWAILFIVICHVSSICDADGTDEEIMYPNQTFRENSYSNQYVIHGLHPKIKLQTQAYQIILASIQEFYL
jgi:hypothetical protein